MFYLLGMLAAISSPLPSFQFSSLNAGRTVPTNNRELVNCIPDGHKRICELSRRSFSDIPIRQSDVTVRNDHLESLLIRADNSFYDAALEALTAKYGRPYSATAFPDTDRSASWNFAEGYLTIVVKGKRLPIVISYVSRVKSPKIDF